MTVPFSIAAVCCCVLLVIPSQSRDLSFLLSIGNESAAFGLTRLVRIPLIAAVTGLVCALGMATKLTFFPLVLISLLCCRSRRNLLTFAVAFILGLAFVLLPIYSRLGQLTTWIVNLGIRSGRYDSGDIGLPSSSVYLSALARMVQAEPLVVIVPIVATIALLGLFLASGKKSAENNIGWHTALVLLAIQVVSLFLARRKWTPTI